MDEAERKEEKLTEKFVNLWPVEAHTDTETDDNLLAISEKEPTPDVGVLQIEPQCLLESGPLADPSNDVRYEMYESELQMPDIMRLMKTALSEPYSIYTYRYFIHNWPKLCILAKCEDCCVGAIVCKLEMHHYNNRRGYIAMLAVDEKYRKRKIGVCGGNEVLRMECKY